MMFASPHLKPPASESRSDADNYPQTAWQKDASFTAFGTGDCLERACQLISAATEQMTQPYPVLTVPAASGGMLEADVFPTMDETERAMIFAAHEKSERKPLVAAQLFGIAKTTFYRKLKELAIAPTVEAATLRLAA